jgi:glycosyltransferase involved in cell wall biosynthesis
MRIVIVTKIFPNAMEPLSSPFNRQQFDALSRLADVRLLATIPWFPGAAWLARWSPAGRLSAVPKRERIGALEVEHPRTLFVPRVGHLLSGPLYAASLYERLRAERARADVILGSWAYPDGYGAVVLGRLLGAPAVIKLHGSDINVVAKIPGPRRQLSWALPRAAAVIAVSEALRERAIDLGVEPDRVHVVRNGVDRELFRPRDRAAARARFGLSPRARIALYVGRLEREKGVFDLLDAFELVRRRMPEALLVLVGGGSAAARARAMPGVLVAGPQPLALVPHWMAAANVATLPSWNEGMPNVVLEALASGRRVIASSVGGIPEVISDPRFGEIVPPRAPRELSAALERALALDYDPATLAAHAAIGSWQDSARRLHGVLERACAKSERRAA